MHRPGFSRHGFLSLGDLAGIGVDPLQTRRLRDLRQILQRQIVGLNLRQAGGTGRYSFRCNCLGRHWLGCGASWWRFGKHGYCSNSSHGCYEFSSWLRTLLLDQSLI